MTTDLRPHSERPALGAAFALALLVVAACSPAATPSASPSTAPGGTGGPTIQPSPTASPIANGIPHPTGATDVVLRVESGGGMIAGSFATAIPSFSLYGDGTVVFRDPNASPPAADGNLNRLTPFQTLRLNEEGIQALLADAIERGGLGIATGPYLGRGADMPTTTFTINADGRTKQVNVMALSPEAHPDNVGIITALAGLAQRLDGFASVVAGEQIYVPTAYRGVLMSIDQPFGPVLDWPWPAIQPAAFVSDDGGFVTLRTMTAAEVALLGASAIEGGFESLNLKAPDGKLYALSLRPLLPDETK